MPYDGLTAKPYPKQLSCAQLCGLSCLCVKIYAAFVVCVSKSKVKMLSVKKCGSLGRTFHVTRIGSSAVTEDETMASTIQGSYQ